MFETNRKQMLIGVILLVAVVFGAGYKTAVVKENKIVRSAAVVNKPAPQAKVKVRTVTVHITGAVVRPGVYSFNEGARVIDGINKAGVAKDAELNYINLAELLTDQQQVAVPKKGEIKEYSQASGSVGVPGGRDANNLSGISTRSGKININTAGINELDRLPGIGPAFAQRIVAYRSEHGPFRSVNELTKVSGIGEKKFAQIKDQVTI